MAILKAVTGGRLDGAVLAAREEASRERQAAREEAARTRREAEEVASRIVAAAREEAEAIRTAARERGREEALADVAATLAGAAAARDRLLTAFEDEVVALALEVARRVVGELATRETGVAVESARRALEAARGRPGVILRVHPDDAAAVREAVGPAACGGLALVEDARVARGGAVVETGDGTVVDATLDPRLAALGRALAEGA